MLFFAFIFTFFPPVPLKGEEEPPLGGQGGQVKIKAKAKGKRTKFRHPGL
jgi:hypothetical protein